MRACPRPIRRGERPRRRAVSNGFVSRYADFHLNVFIIGGRAHLLNSGKAAVLQSAAQPTRIDFMDETILIIASVAFVGAAVAAHCWAWFRSRAQGTHLAAIGPDNR